VTILPNSIDSRSIIANSTAAIRPQVFMLAST
jgi:hypothetical protein